MVAREVIEIVERNLCQSQEVIRFVVVNMSRVERYSERDYWSACLQSLR